MNQVNKLESLKLFFKELINSNRKYSNIKQFSDLVVILEERDYFYNILGDNYNLSEITEEWLVQYVQSQSNHLIDLNIEPKLNVFVKEILISRLGSDWKELAYHLRIPDPKSFTGPTHTASAENIIMEFERLSQGISKNELHFRLRRALEKTNRLDMRSDIDKILRN